MKDDLASRRAYMPAGSERVLDSRSLALDHARLAGLLSAGLDVLDVGCGTGAITQGIAQAVAPGGRVLGIDANAPLIALAQARARHLDNLAFQVSDLASFSSEESFDVVSAARVLSWLANPARALRSMCAATRPGGKLVVLDYNHEKISWEPTPPDSVLVFYRAFMEWRAQAGMDNAIAERLPALFEQAGLEQLESHLQPEVARRGEPNFQNRIGLWANVIATRGHHLVADGVLQESERASAEADYGAWSDSEAERQTLHLLSVEGTRPA